MNPLILKRMNPLTQKIVLVINIEDESIDPEKHRVILYKNKPVISI
jgi:hypothetical protein